MTACARRHKGIDDKLKRAFPKDDPHAQPFRSHQPRRCKGQSGPSGKSDNAGKAPTFEQIISGTGTKAQHRKGQPGRTRPSKAQVIR